jgi:hypothetical protein
MPSLASADIPATMPGIQLQLLQQQQQPGALLRNPLLPSPGHGLSLGPGTGPPSYSQRLGQWLAATAPVVLGERGDSSRLPGSGAGEGAASPAHASGPGQRALLPGFRVRARSRVHAVHAGCAWGCMA